MKKKPKITTQTKKLINYPFLFYRMKNKELSEIFNEMADMLEILGVEWKPQAFRKAARTIEAESNPVEKIYKEKGEKGLIELDGIGKGIASKIIQYIEKGKIDEYEELKKKIPEGVREMLLVHSLGPKKVSILYQKLGIDSLSKLEKFAKEEKIRKLKGFGEKSEEDILMGLGLVQKGKERKLMGIILPHAQELIHQIRKIKNVEKVEIAGSLRRRKETVKDIDIVAFTSNPEKLSEELTHLPNVKGIERKGNNLTSIQLEMGINADIRILKPELYGSGLVHFTGSKEHGIAIRKRAIEKGMKFSEYGLTKNRKIIASQTEEDVYVKLGLAFIPPEMRENNGEIELAEKNKLPKLVELKDIKGDLHLHTNWSDGKNTSEEMVQACMKKGYEYMAITDHSKSSHVANGLDEKRVKQHILELDKLQKKYPQIRILKGSEVDILSEGKMDYSNSLLKELDFVIGSIHSGFKNTSKQMTERLLGALSNEYVHSIGHPTGRLINQRNPYEFDLEKVLEQAKEQNKSMEINSHPSRLDFNPEIIRDCVEKNVSLAVNTDAHHTNQLDFMELGVSQARRGWAERKNILNTLSWKEFSKRIGF